jgi:hypothetical protein
MARVLQLPIDEAGVEFRVVELASASLSFEDEWPCSDVIHDGMRSVGHEGGAKLTRRRDDDRVVMLRRSVLRLSATDRVKPD